MSQCKTYSSVLCRGLCNEVGVTFCSVTYITCPADPQKTLAIKLPFLILVIKNMKKYFTFEVQVQTSPA